MFDLASHRRRRATQRGHAARPDAQPRNRAQPSRLFSLDHDAHRGRARTPAAAHAGCRHRDPSARRPARQAQHRQGAARVVALDQPDARRKFRARSRQPLRMMCALLHEAKLYGTCAPTCGKRRRNRFQNWRIASARFLVPFHEEATAAAATRDTGRDTGRDIDFESWPARFVDPRSAAANRRSRPKKKRRGMGHFCGYPGENRAAPRRSASFNGSE
ncbi:hypothetical protein [Burkholderia sp. ABCPW 111]|uniref:hypothetical protein n=1 Tax=Burkholderia sp. ABCPW 111 TaxID=1820025 RepID=UPI00126A328F|nr:hypothetical protein [Burkholderia sp. ABCPW 111]